MKCANCDQENSEQAKFCNNCGVQFDKQETARQESQVAIPPTNQVNTQANAVIPQEAHPNSTPMIIFSIINIVCCGSFILGVIALVYALMSANEKDIQEVKNKLRISKTLNIIGIVLGILKVLIFIIFIILILIYGSGQTGTYSWGDYY